MEVIFPDIYNLVLFQQRTIAELWTPHGWNFNFRRQLNDREVMRVVEFFNTVDLFNGRQTVEDVLWWMGNEKGMFSVNKAYKMMNQINHPDPRWPWKQIWKSRIPHTVSCFVFVWLLTKEVVLTQDNVMKKGKTLCSRCFLCGETLETVNHVFLHCKYTQQLWRIVLRLKGISRTMPRKVSETLMCWEKQVYMRRTEVDGELSLVLYGGLYGKKGILDVLRAQRIVCRRLNSTALCFYVFGVINYTLMILPR